MGKIAYVGFAGSPSGGTRILIEHLNRLVDLGHECTMFYLLPGQTARDWMEIKFAERKMPDGPSQDYFDAVVATEINTWPVVHNNMSFPNANGRFLFMQMDEYRFFRPESDDRAKYSNYYQFIDSLQPIVISDWLYNIAGSHSTMTPYIVRNGVNTDMFYPDPFPDRPSKPVILIEGHANNDAKDVAYMGYRAAQWLRGQGYDFELWGFSQWAQPYELDRYWRLPSQDTIRKIYSSADILIKASKYEGRSCVDVEAMACGCAVNRAILTGDDDLIHEFNCLKTSYGRMRDFSTNLKRLFDDVELRSRLVKNGFDYVRSYLNWDDIIPRLESILMTGKADGPFETRYEPSRE